MEDVHPVSEIMSNGLEDDKNIEEVPYFTDTSEKKPKKLTCNLFLLKVPLLVIMGSH